MMTARRVSWWVAALVLAAGIAGCTPPPRDYPGSSVPPASPLPVRSGLYERVPRACATLDKTATLLAIAPGIGAGSEQDFSENGVIQEDCNWPDASGPGWNRSLLVVVELETGADARVNADDQYQNEVTSDLPPATQVIRGLGDKAQYGEKTMKVLGTTGAWSATVLHILVQNVVITVQYTGQDLGGAMAANEMRNGTLAAARAVLTALH